MNFNQIVHSQNNQNLNFQHPIASNGNTFLNENSTANSNDLIAYNYSSQANDAPPNLYTLNLSQPANPINNIFDKNAYYSLDDSSSIICKKEKLHSSKNVHLRDTDDMNESNVNDDEANQEFKKRKKFKPDPSLTNNECNSYVYQNHHMPTGYFPNRSSLASLSTSSSPISSSSSTSSPLYNQINGSLKSNSQLNNQNNIYLANYNESMSSSYHYFGQHVNHSKLAGLDEVNKLYNNETNKLEDCQEIQDSEYSSCTKIKKSKKDPIAEYDTELAEAIEYELGLKKQNGPRKNSWGNLSYAELITRAIESSSDQRLTLSQIYDWIIKYVPYFKEKYDRTSSAGWKNSIRHNLSLHNRFIRVQNESSGKSSWWMINPDISKYNLPIGNDCKYSMNNTSLNIQSFNSDTNNSIELTNSNYIEADVKSCSADKITNFENNEFNKRDSETNKIADVLLLNKNTTDADEANQNEICDEAKITNNFDINVTLNGSNDSTRAIKTKNKHRFNSKINKKNKNKQLKLEHGDQLLLESIKSVNYDVKIESINDNEKSINEPSPSNSLSPSSSSCFDKNKDLANPVPSFSDEKFSQSIIQNADNHKINPSNITTQTSSTTINSQFLNNSSSLVDSPISTTSSLVSTSPPAQQSLNYQNLINSTSGSILRAALQKSVNTPPTPTSTPSSVQNTTGQQTVTYNNYNNSQIFSTYPTYGNCAQLNGYQSNGTTEKSYINGYQSHNAYNQPSHNINQSDHSYFQTAANNNHQLYNATYDQYLKNKSTNNSRAYSSYYDSIDSQSSSNVYQNHSVYSNQYRSNYLPTAANSSNLEQTTFYDLNKTVTNQPSNTGRNSPCHSAGLVSPNGQHNLNSASYEETNYTEMLNGSNNLNNMTNKAVGCYYS